MADSASTSSTPVTSSGRLIGVDIESVGNKIACVGIVIADEQGNVLQKHFIPFPFKEQDIDPKIDKEFFQRSADLQAKRELWLRNAETTTIDNAAKEVVDAIDNFTLANPDEPYRIVSDNPEFDIGVLNGVLVPKYRLFPLSHRCVRDDDGVRGYEWNGTVVNVDSLYQAFLPDIQQRWGYASVLSKRFGFELPKNRDPHCPVADAEHIIKEFVAVRKFMAPIVATMYLTFGVKPE